MAQFSVVSGQSYNKWEKGETKRHSLQFVYSFSSWFLVLKTEN